MMDLFTPTESNGQDNFEIFQLKDGEIWLMRNFLNQKEAGKYFEILYSTIHFKLEQVKYYGKIFQVPRKTAWYGYEGLNYSYSGIKRSPEQWTKELMELKLKIEAVMPGHEFNSVLLNLYRDGNDKVGWHADDEREFGRNPTIASLSLGATRRFDIKHRTDHDLSYKFELTPGSLIVMTGTMQHHWLHQVPAQKKVTKPRINLTFRKILLK